MQKRIAIIGLGQIGASIGLALNNSRFLRFAILPINSIAPLISPNFKLNPNFS